LMIRGVTVEHILSRANHRTHVLTSWARINGNDIIYPSPDVFDKE
jgi:hypothetical protein